MARKVHSRSILRGMGAPTWRELQGPPDGWSPGGRGQMGGALGKRRVPVGGALVGGDQVGGA